MKRDLVRVVANMVHAHSTNQDLVSSLLYSAPDLSGLTTGKQVRKLDGIPLVLNCCRVDDDNPCTAPLFIFHRNNALELSLTW